MKNTGWICPKCQRVYAPTQTECAACNTRPPTPSSGVKCPVCEREFTGLHVCPGKLRLVPRFG